MNTHTDPLALTGTQSPYAHHWRLDPETIFLNHGSFGACPAEVIDHQQRLRLELENEPVRFFDEPFETKLDQARQTLGDFVGAPPKDIAPVSNATTAVNTVLRSLSFNEGDEILVTNHGYQACTNAAQFVADQCGAKVVTADIPFPIDSPQQVIQAIMDAVTPKTRLALIDHITSPTALIFPIQTIVAELKKRGIDTLVDGAHAPGMIPLDIEAIGPTYYTGNCHKWMCAPKSVAFLYVHPDRQSLIRPLTISHGATMNRADRSRFLVEFDWPGTTDQSALFAIPRTIDYLGQLFDNGWQGVRDHNRELALSVRRLLCDALDLTPPCPEEMVGSFAALILPDTPADDPYVLAPPPQKRPSPITWLQTSLYRDYHLQIPVPVWPSPPHRMIRFSAQLYNHLDQYRQLGQALKTLL